VQAQKFNEAVHTDVLKGRAKFEQWQREYDSDFASAPVNLKTIGRNMMGKTIKVKGHIANDEDEEVSGMVLSVASEEGRVDQSQDMFEFLVMYEDGASHWEDLANKNTKHPWDFA